MSQAKLQTLYAQRQTFETAYAKKEISQSNYNTAMAFVNAQIRAEQAQLSKSPMPYDPSNPPATVAGPQGEVYLRSDYKVVENPSIKGGQTSTQVGFEPVNKPKPTVPPQFTASIMQGGSEIPLSNPLGENPILDTAQKREIALAAVTTVAAPGVGQLIGVGAKSVIVGEALSVGIEQGFKVAGGGGLLTPQQALESAAVGGAFTLAGGAVFKGIGYVGKVAGVGLPEGAKGTASSILGRAAVNAGLSGGTSYAVSGGDLEATKQGLAFGAAFSFGLEGAGRLSPFVPRLAVERPSFAEGYKTRGGLLTFYSTRSSEPKIIGYAMRGKVGLGTPTVSPEVYAAKTPSLSLNYESPFKSAADVKLYEKALRTSGQPQPEIEVFSGGKQLVYAAQQTKIPKSDVPKKLAIETERDPYIGKAAETTLKDPEFRGDVEFYGSSAVHSVYPEFRLGGDIDVQAFKTPEQLSNFATKLAANANRLSGTTEYIAKENNVFRGNARLTDLHFRGEPPAKGNVSGASSTFGLKQKAPLLIEKVKVMNPTSATVTKGSSSLTPRKFTGQTATELKDLIKAFPEAPEYKAMLTYVEKGKSFYGSSPAAYRSKDVTDFLATSKILNERYWGGSQSSNINRLIRLYEQKGLTSQAKVDAAAGLMSEDVAVNNLMRYQSQLPSAQRSTVSLSPSIKVVSASRLSEKTRQQYTSRVSPSNVRRSLGSAWSQASDSLASSSPSKGSIWNGKPSSNIFKESPPSKPSLSPDTSKPSYPIGGSPEYPRPSSPSIISTPSPRSPSRLPSLSFGGGGGGDFGRRDSKTSGLWYRRTHAIPKPKQVVSQVLGGGSTLKVKSLGDIDQRMFNLAQRKGRRKR